jgi:hypothetical protein
MLVSSKGVRVCLLALRVGPAEAEARRSGLSCFSSFANLEMEARGRAARMSLVAVKIDLSLSANRSGDRRSISLIAISKPAPDASLRDRA